MKFLNFCLFVLLSTMLFACAPKPLNDHEYASWLHSLNNPQQPEINYHAHDDWRHALGTPERSDMVYDGNTIIKKEKKVEQIDPAVVHVAKTQGDYMEVMARQFRQDLISTGSQVKKDGIKVYVYMPTQSIFGSNQVVIKPSIEPALKAIVQNFKNHPETMIRIIGHTDNSLGVLQSKALSLRQAEVLTNYLRQEGIDSKRLLAEGYGSMDPIANNNTPEGRDRNRYIEMIVYNLQ